MILNILNVRKDNYLSKKFNNCWFKYLVDIVHPKNTFHNFFTKNVYSLELYYIWVIKLNQDNVREFLSCKQSIYSKYSPVF